MPGWPRLTESREGRCFSQAELADLQEYAAARHITVVPEIDLPGHCAAVVRAYPQVGMMSAPRTGQPRLAALTRPLDPLDPASRQFAEDAYACIAGATAGPVLLSPQSHLYLDRPYDLA